MKRAVIIVIDSMGIGAMPDCEDFGDVPECNTLNNVAKFNGGLKLPNLIKLGLGNIWGVDLTTRLSPLAQYGIMQELSKGKDTTTGHWEIAGLILDKPFATFPKGFPDKIINEFIEKTGCKGILANIPASGTAIIEELNKQHQQTKFPIVYTSADSVFQIAVDTDLIPLETLYKWCEIAREMLPKTVSRVIARPYNIIDGKPTRISKDRRDYAVKPYKDTVLNKIKNAGGAVIGIGKIEDIFAKSGITHAIHTGSNKQGLELTLQAIKDELPLEDIKYPDFQGNLDKSLIFTNLVDTDMLYGHRNDAKGYGKALEEIDKYVGQILNVLKDDDLLIITADHGCDPTVKGTDHTREFVPVIFYKKDYQSKDLGLIKGFDFIARKVENHLEI